MADQCPTCGKELSASDTCAACEVAIKLLMEDESGDNASDVRCEETSRHFGSDHEDGIDRSLSAATLAQIAQPFPPPATACPNPLPPPLSDPLRALKWVYTVMLGLLLVALAIDLSIDVSDGRPFLLVYGTGIAAIWTLFGIWRLLPFRRTDVFYLRSFARDASTGSIRADIQRLIRPLRLSGIHDPRTRSIPLLRHLNQLVFVLRYVSPARLNLEAGDDWKQRLWRSLTLARGAIVDVTDLTSYVKDEVRLCYRTLGLNRVMFLIDERKTVDEWRVQLAAILELSDPAAIRVAQRPHVSTARATFQAAISEFRHQLPPSPPAPSAAGSEIAYQFSVLEDEPSKQSGVTCLEVVGGTILTSVLLAIVSLLNDKLRFGPVSLVIFCVAVWLTLLQIRAMLIYLAECGSSRERFLTLGTLGVGLLAIPLLSTAPVFWTVKVAKNMYIVASQLKELAIAMHAHVDAHHYLPGADADANGMTPTPDRPAVSWRVKILPYLKRDALTVAYRSTEPWDSPHNQRLLDQMPKVFEHPSRTAPPGHTYYRVFVSPTNAGRSTALFTHGRRGSSLAEIIDGSSNTILIVDAVDSVPWTMPEGIEFKPSHTLQFYSGHFPRGTQAAFADGAVRTLPPGLPQKVLRALITSAGEERLEDY